MMDGNGSSVKPELVRLLRAEAEDAERMGRLTAAQLNIIYREGWFRMFVPKSLGGLAYGLPEGLRLQEQLAQIDGSLGWTITLCSGATMFAGFLSPDLAQELFADKQVCLGGSGAAGGTAIKVEEGYRIRGKWKYATGAPHLTAFTANCTLVEENGKAVLNEAGNPAVHSFVFKPNEVRVSPDWDAMGLKATAGHSFEADDVAIPANRRFTIASSTATIEAPLYQFPFMPFAEMTIAVNTSGIALHFLESCNSIFTSRMISGKYSKADCTAYHAMLHEATKMLHSLRESFFDIADSSWDEVCATSSLREKAQEAAGTASRNLAQGTRQIVQALFPFCGMTAANPHAEINRVWRDIFTASQHSLLNVPYRI